MASMAGSRAGKRREVAENSLPNSASSKHPHVPWRQEQGVVCKEHRDELCHELSGFG